MQDLPPALPQQLQAALWAPQPVPWALYLQPALGPFPPWAPRPAAWTLQLQRVLRPFQRSRKALPVFVRADIGTDILIGMADDADTAEVLLRVNAAAGFDLGMVQLAAESVNSFILTESEADPLSSVGVTAAFGIDAATVYAGVSVPVSSGLADVQGQPVVVSTGVRVGF